MRICYEDTATAPTTADNNVNFKDTGTIVAGKNGLREGGELLTPARRKAPTVNGWHGPRRHHERQGRHYHNRTEGSTGGGTSDRNTGGESTGGGVSSGDADKSWDRSNTGGKSWDRSTGGGVSRGEADKGSERERGRLGRERPVAGVMRGKPMKLSAFATRHIYLMRED